MFEYLMYISQDHMCMFRYLKTPDIILSLVSSKKNWTGLILLAPTARVKNG